MKAGHKFRSKEVVTPRKLNKMVNNAVLDKQEVEAEHLDDEAVTSRAIAKEAITADHFSLDALRILASVIVPVGTQFDFMGAEDKIPEGYLLCDGRAVSRAEYDVLFDALGTIWGEGDGYSTFNIPDSRGRYTRGSGNVVENGVAQESSGGDVGTRQENTVGTHKHELILRRHSSYGGGGIASIVFPIDASVVTNEGASGVPGKGLTEEAVGGGTVDLTPWSNTALKIIKAK